MGVTVVKEEGDSQIVIKQLSEEYEYSSEILVWYRMNAMKLIKVSLKSP